MDGLAQLIATDFHRRCATVYYCFQCQGPLCLHCCSSPKNHSLLHHGGHGPDPAELDLVCGTPCIRSDDMKGSGYCSHRIQRFKRFQHKWIPILPQPLDDSRLKRFCQNPNCGRKLKSGAQYCCVRCRAHLINNGNARAMALDLARFAEHYNQPVVRLDRFCRICCLAYCSRSCPNHMMHHEDDPQEAAAAIAAGVIISVQEFDGLPVVEDYELPGDYVDQVQAIELEDGRIFYPVHGRTVHQLAALAEDQVGAHPCGREDCPEVFRGPALFCSLRCSHQA